MNSPLENIRVLEITNELSVQVCGMLLADLGAKVSHPNGPAPTTAEHERVKSIAPILQRGKTELAFTFDLSRGIAQIKSQLASTDVVLMGPSMTHAAAREFAALARQENSLLVDIHMPAFPEDLSTIVGEANTEGAIGAATGLYTDISMFRSVLGLPPAYTDLPMPSIYAGVHGAIAVLSSVKSRRAAKTGDSVTVPLAAAVTTSMASSLLEVSGQPNRYDLPPIPRVIKSIVLPIIRTLTRHGSPRMQKKIAALGDKLLPPFMRTYTTADDKLLYLFAMDHDKLPAALLDCLGISHKLPSGDIAVTNPYKATRQDNLADPGMLAKPFKKELCELIAETVASRAASYWENKLNAAGIPFAVHNRFSEWCEREEVKKAGLIASCLYTPDGKLAMPGKFVTVEGPSTLGSQNALTATDKPLSGIKVLDLSTMVAGPVCARTMAELGAEVIKIDSPTPHHGPRMTCWYGLEVNQGKKTVLLDIHRKEGADAFCKMLSGAHVVVHNFSDKAARKLGVDAASLKQKAPHVLLCSVGAFQGETAAPWDTRKGYDPVIQAATGIQMRYGSSQSPQLHAIASCIDYLTGYIAAMGILAAMEAGQKKVAVSLAQAAQLMQILYFSEKNDRQTPSGQNAVGTDDDNRIYQTRDGHVFLAAEAGQGRLVNHVLNTKDDTASAREKAFSGKKTNHWLEEFQKAGITLIAVKTVKEFARLGSSMANLKTNLHPSGHIVTQLAQGHMTSKLWQLAMLEPFEKPGFHTKAALSDAGVSDQQIDIMLACKTASESWSEKYLP